MWTYHFRAILWKNYLLRRRNCFATSLEILFPIVAFLIVAMFNSKLSKTDTARVEYVTQYDTEVILDDKFKKDQSEIYYSPSNKYFDGLIIRVGEKFQMSNSSIHGFEDQQQLVEQSASSTKNNVFLIIFHSAADSTNLDYTIRVREHISSMADSHLETKKLYGHNNTHTGLGSHYLKNGFVAIQRAVDISFVEIEQEKRQRFSKILASTAQEFPHPPHKKADSMTLLLIWIPYVTWFSFSFLFTVILSSIAEEKSTGIKELMKVVGVSDWVIWLGWFIQSVLPMLVVVSVIVILLKVNIAGGVFPPIEYTQGTIVFVFLMLCICANTVMCFFMCTWMNVPVMTALIGDLVLAMTFFIPHELLISMQLVSFSGAISMMLMPQAAMSYGYRAISYYELGHVGVSWSNCHDAGEEQISMLNVFIMLIVDCVFYMLLTLYLDPVNPGKFGKPKSVFFPFEALSKCFKRKNEDVAALARRSFILQNVEMANLPVGIELKNVTKVYGKKPVVKDLSLDIYEDHITVLLGHNGAGKTTTLGIIAGLINQTTGKIIIDGVEVRSRSDTTKSLGICLQDNLFFATLTVMEHLQIFATLKGQKKRDSHDEIQILLSKLNMAEKRNTPVDKLSRVMQRKLSLAMALVGGSKILILDEPSSGMDPESRRELWNMLHELRSEKTILITTHFMEEADALGDWIAILNEGELVCFGTPVYLKKKYETGSHLILLIKKDKSVRQAVQKIEELLKGQLNFKTAKCKSIKRNEVRFFLPPGNYVKLFEYLEPNKGQYDIDNISFTRTTLEDVFLSSKVNHQEEEDKDIQTDIESIERMHNTSFCLTLRALLYKRYRFIFRKYVGYIVATITGLLLILGCVCLVLFAVSPHVGGPSLRLSLSDYGDTTVYGSAKDPSTKIGKIYEKLISDQESNFELVDDVSKSIIEKADETDLLFMRYKMIIAAEFIVSKANNQETLEAVAMYNSNPVHSAAISFNLISNTIAKYILGEEYSITTRNHPLIIMSERLYLTQTGAHNVTLWMLMLPLAILFFIGIFIYFPLAESSTNFTQTQFMCGVHPFVYWLTNFLLDFIVYSIFIFIATIILNVSWPLFGGAKEIGVMFLILAVHGLSAIPFAYLFSRIEIFASAYIQFVLTGTYGGVFFIVVLLMKESPHERYHMPAKVMHIIFLVVCPQYGLSYFGYEYTLKVLENYNIGHESMDCVGDDKSPCCFGSSQACDEWKSYMKILNPDIWLMVVSALIFFSAVVILDCYCLKRVLNWAKIRVFCYDRGRDKEIDTGAEKVDHNTLQVKNIKKRYWRTQVVKDVSFSVTRGQCMGILGVNGAGKTTMVRMLTREAVMDEGTIRINAHSIENVKYIKRLGYCPQEDALNFSLSAREILRAMAMLRGIKDVKIVDQFLDMFDLTTIADIKCEHYSGGNRRKLTFAIAVIGFPDFILLDEPTTGVDPLSKHKFWSLIRQIRDTNQNAFIVTSHSLHECESVCDELKILKEGLIKKEGPIALLKTEVNGFNVMLKLDKEKVTSGQGTFLKTSTELKNYLKQKFPTMIIRDEHSGLIEFYIKTNEKKWAQLFSTVEDLKQKCDLIEDYAISEASLEDVFLTVFRPDQ